ncbi:hypothetical protein H2200_000132 [Cladophialophora chaetospira]|uniref:Uncharacterized protein n=1 Tax=Cladophialophora chaetospira TaxID=386627 RepID=A0AA38XMZ0_9EURO|nr:hypothetical protein H2200_000132 [Cladophialophora chaetospira]
MPPRLGEMTPVEDPTSPMYPIFQYFETLRSERDKIIKSRYALQLVCKQINNIWSPIFFSTTTIVASKVKRAKRNPHKDTKHMRLSDKSITNFMTKSLSANTMQTIRKLYCDVTHQVRPGFGVIINTECSESSVEQLARFVGGLPSIQEFTFAGRGYHCTTIPVRALGALGSLDMDSMWSYPALSYEPVWRDMKKRVYDELKSATSKDWAVLRRIQLTICNRECACQNRQVPTMHQIPLGLVSVRVQEAQVVFRRAASVVARSENDWAEVVGY